MGGYDDDEADRPGPEDQTVTGAPPRSFVYRAERVTFGGDLEITAPSGSILGTVGNISESGLFLATGESIDVDTEVWLSLPLGFGSPVPMKAVVVWCRSRGEQGLGMRSLEMTGPVLERLRRLVDDIIDDADDPEPEPEPEPEPVEVDYAIDE